MDNTTGSLVVRQTGTKRKLNGLNGLMDAQESLEAHYPAERIPELRNFARQIRHLCDTYPMGAVLNYEHAIRLKVSRQPELRLDEASAFATEFYEHVLPAHIAREAAGRGGADTRGRGDSSAFAVKKQRDRLSDSLPLGTKRYSSLDTPTQDAHTGERAGKSAKRKAADGPLKSAPCNQFNGEGCSRGIACGFTHQCKVCKNTVPETAAAYSRSKTCPHGCSSSQVGGGGGKEF